MNDAELRATVARHEREIATIRREHGRRLTALENGLDDGPGHDPKTWRKRLLRRAWRAHYPGLSRDGAARALAIDWKAFAERRSNAEPEPSSRDAVFAQLAAGQCQPVSARTIFDDLDPAFDR